MWQRSLTTDLQRSPAARRSPTRISSAFPRSRSRRVLLPLQELVSHYCLICPWICTDGARGAALQAIEHNPASGVIGPAAGTFGGLWTQEAVDKQVEANKAAIDNLDSSAAGGHGTAGTVWPHETHEAPESWYGGTASASERAPAGDMLAFASSGRRRGGEGGGGVEAGSSGSPYQVYLKSRHSVQQQLALEEALKGEKAPPPRPAAAAPPPAPPPAAQAPPAFNGAVKLPTKAAGAGSCAACLVCYECCASGWIPGCGGYEDVKGDTAAAAMARSSAEASAAAKAQGAIADQLGYVLDPGQTALIDQRLGAQMEKTISEMVTNRAKTHREENLQKLKDSDQFQRAKMYEEDRKMQEALKNQQLAVQALPLETIALPPVNRFMKIHFCPAPHAITPQVHRLIFRHALQITGSLVTIPQIRDVADRARPETCR